MLSMDQQGTHVVQKILQGTTLLTDKVNFVFRELADQVYDLCVNKNGLCVMKILIERMGDSKQRAQVFRAIKERAVELSQDQYGNFAITEIVTKWRSEECTPIFECLVGKLTALSAQEYSSHVVEWCLEYAPDAFRSAYIDELSHSE